MTLLGFTAQPESAQAAAAQAMVAFSRRHTARTGLRLGLLCTRSSLVLHVVMQARHIHLLAPRGLAQTLALQNWLSMCTARAALAEVPPVLEHLLLPASPVLQ